MATLKDLLTSDEFEGLPETVDPRELYVENDGRYELKVPGVRTSADVENVKKALDRERAKHKETRDKMSWAAELDPEDVRDKLSRFDDLEAAAADKIDDEKIDQMAQKRADGLLRGKLAPMERKLADTEKERDELRRSVDTLSAAAMARKRDDELRPLLRDRRVDDEFFDDAFLRAKEELEPDDEGVFRVRDGITGRTPGADMRSWLEEVLEQRPKWLKGSVGGGSTGSRAGSNGRGPNPWTHEHWNLTEQGRYVREHGMERAEAAAKAAGTLVSGGQRPPAKS